MKINVPSVIFFCPQVVQFWEEFFQYISTRYKNQEVFKEERNILFNEIVQPKRHVANFLCLVTKQYIYAQKCLKLELNFGGLVFRFKQIENVEKYVAIKNEKLSIHQKKWGY